MDSRNYLPSGKYVQSSDIGDRTILVTIQNAIPEMVKNRDTGKDEEKLVVYFQGAEKGMTLNVGNTNTLGAAFGFETANWVGHKIELFTIQTDYVVNGVAQRGIRIKLPASAASTPLLAPAPAQPAEPPPGHFAGAAPAAAPTAQQPPPTDEIPF